MRTKRDRPRRAVHAFALALLLLPAPACDSAGRDWEQARAAGTVEAYQRFIEVHPDSALIADARRAIDQLALDAAIAAGTVEALESFRKTPRHPELDTRATERIRDLKGEAALAVANRLATIPAFRRVEREHPETASAETARQAVEKLLAERDPAVRSVRRVAITVQAPASLATVPIAKAAGEILALAGVDVAGAGEAAGASLRIEARASGDGRSYSRFGLSFEDSVYRVTGASVSGRIQLETGEPPAKWSREFSGRVPPSEVVEISKGGAEEAPPYFAASGFDHTDDPQVLTIGVTMRQPDVVDPGSTLAVRLVELVGSLFGPSVARAALTEPTRFRWAVLRASTPGDPEIVDRLLELLPKSLGDMDFVVGALGRARDPRAVPALLPLLANPVREPVLEALGTIGDRSAAEPLIDLLVKVMADERMSYQTDDVIGALTRIAGRSFGRDVDAWKSWAQQR